MPMHWILILVGVAIAGTSLFGAVGILRPNGFIGIRTVATRRSADAWQAGHAQAAKIMVPAGALLVVFGIGLLLGWPLFDSLGESALIVGVVIAVIATIIGNRMASQAAKST